MKKARKNEICGVLFLLMGLFTLASMIFFAKEDLGFYTSHPASPMMNYTGIVGAYLAFGLFLLFGVSAYLIPFLFLLWSSCFFMQKVPERKLFKIVGLFIALASLSTLVSICVKPEFQFVRGGMLGYFAGSHLLKYFGFLGGVIVSTSCLLLSLLLATDFLLYPLVKKFWDQVGGAISGFFEKVGVAFEWVGHVAEDAAAPLSKIKKEKTAKADKSKPTPVMPSIPIKVKKYRPEALDSTEEKNEADSRRRSAGEEARSRGRKETAEQSGPKRENGEEGRHEGVIGSKSLATGYQLPKIDFFKKLEAAPLGNADDLQGNSKILETTLGEFGIEVRVVEVEQGPVITRYELLPAPGVKVNSITTLSDDIALALKATSVRIIAPIPGKSAVGIEVPNSVSSLVFVRELVESKEFRSHKQVLPLLLGKSTNGKNLIGDLADMPHLLIAGATGSGKTVCVNSVIAGLLYYATPEDLKFVMIDPKMVELAMFNKLPHMLAPVVTDVRKASHTLNWVVNEMENRYKLLATVGVRNIKAFNSRPLSEETEEEMKEAEPSENVVPVKLPYIVVIIDELADLMMVAQDKVETAIMRLAQLSRAVGIHLILATQRPSVNVITGVIKANLPARISFKVASKVDSRTVLDANGAEKLLGRGDMLFVQPGTDKPVRGQGALITDEEINKIVEFLSEQGTPEFHSEILQAQEGKTALGAAMEKDEIFDEAVSVVLETGQASTSNLQRRLRLGYTRAARIIDQMEAEGLIGPSQGAKPRDIYIDRESRSAVEEEF